MRHFPTLALPIFIHADFLRAVVPCSVLTHMGTLRLVWPHFDMSTSLTCQNLCSGRHLTSRLLDSGAVLSGAGSSCGSIASSGGGSGVGDRRKVCAFKLLFPLMERLLPAQKKRAPQRPQRRRAVKLSVFESFCPLFSGFRSGFWRSFPVVDGRKVAELGFGAMDGDIANLLDLIE